MNFKKIFINGAWISSDTNNFIPVENPATQTCFAEVPACGEKEVDKAAKAAYAAFPGWSSLPLSTRIAYMEEFLRVFRSQENELIDITIKELGSPRAFTKSAQVEYQYTRTRSYIDLAPSVPLEETMEHSHIYREPLGVIGCITPWNYPLGQVIQKIIPAMLMGNTVILKPSQHTPLSSYWLADAFEKSGLPKGVFNLVTGRGGEVGNAMATHPLIAMISFTGSTKGGIDVSQNALQSVKRISLELGGKSPYVILKNADYDKAIRHCFDSIFLNSGQTCTAFSRLLIPESDEALIKNKLIEISKEYTIGDPNDESVKIGPMASKQQFEKVKGYIEKGLKEGAHLLLGTIPGNSSDGYFISPVIFTDVTNDMSIAQEEIFGPVLCVITYQNESDAIRIANDTKYGLNAGVYGPDKETAVAVAKRIQAGNVYINDGPRDTAAPFGGYKESGIGREGGIYGMLEFTQQKALFDD